MEVQSHGLYTLFKPAVQYALLPDASRTHKNPVVFDSGCRLQLRWDATEKILQFMDNDTDPLTDLVTMQVQPTSFDCYVLRTGDQGNGCYEHVVLYQVCLPESHPVYVLDHTIDTWRVLYQISNTLFWTEAKIGSMLTNRANKVNICLNQAYAVLDVTFDDGNGLEVFLKRRV